MPDALPHDLLVLRDRIESLVDSLRPLEAGLGPDEAPSPEARAEARTRSRAAGIFGMTQPAAFGGTEAGPLAMVVAREAVAAGNTAFARDLFGPVPGLLAGTDGVVRAAYLEPYLRGDRISAFAFTEPANAPRPTWAVRDGGDLLVTGRKAFVSGGASADFYQVLVNVEPAPGLPGGPAMLLVDRGTSGVTIAREFTTAEGGGHVELAFETARVPQANIVGAIGDGIPRAMENIHEERLEIAATACGMALWAVGAAAVHIAAPHRGGGHLGDREGVRLRYADLRIETYAARAVLYRTARLLESGDDAINEAALAKVYCTEVAGRVIDGAMQLVGGQALVRGHALERMARRARSMRFAGGASDLLRLTVARGAVEFGAGRL